MKFNESSTSDSCSHEFWCIWRMHHMSKSACTLRKCGSVRSTRFICLSSSVQNQHLANFSVLLCLGFFLWINSLCICSKLAVHQLVNTSCLLRHVRRTMNSKSVPQIYASIICAPSFVFALLVHSWTFRVGLLFICQGTFFGISSAKKCRSFSGFFIISKAFYIVNNFFYFFQFIHFLCF